MSVDYYRFRPIARVFPLDISETSSHLTSFSLPCWKIKAFNGNAAIRLGSEAHVWDSEVPSSSSHKTGSPTSLSHWKKSGRLYKTFLPLGYLPEVVSQVSILGRERGVSIYFFVQKYRASVVTEESFYFSSHARFCDYATYFPCVGL